MPEGFKILRANVIAEFEEWSALWRATSHREPQAHPAYGTALIPPGNELLCAAFVSDSGSVLMPFLIRDIGLPGSGSLRDAITPYGYGGAYMDGASDLAAFWSAWDNWALEAGVVGLTTRRHLFREEIASADESSFSPLRNVVVETRIDPNELWSSFEGRVRTDVRKGQARGIEVQIDVAGAHMQAFHALYIDTMRRLGAQDYYHFSLERLESMNRAMPGSVVLTHALVDGQIVSSEMQLLGARNAYYFLSGSSADARGIPFGPVMKWEVIKWLHERGVRRYVLGGGLSQDDSLFRYKRGFAPRGLWDFVVGHHTVSRDAVAQLVAQRRAADPSWDPTPDYAPAYRAPSRVPESVS